MEFDVEMNGRLSKTEFRNALNKYGIEMPDEELNTIFASVDADGMGTINYTEWLAAAIKPADVATEKVARDVFDFFDTDGTGSISFDDLREVLGDEAAEAVTSHRSDEGKARLDWNEFKSLMRDIT